MRDHCFRLVPGCKGLLFAAVVVTACKEPEPEATAPVPPPAVSVVAVTMKDVTPATSFVGRVVAADKVDLRARVTGFLHQRLFTEGQDVAAGDTLFLIEPEPFQAAVRQAEADLASAAAEAHNAQLQLDRAEQLVKRQTVAVATRDDRAAELAIAKARVQERQASLDVAKINLTYTEIKAPIAGRIGLAKYSKGNLVGPDSGPLATIVTQDPIYVTFQATQRDVLRAQQRMAEEAIDMASLVVRLTLSDGSDYPHAGKVNFLDAQVNPGTDTATVRAEFANPQRLLTDGAFVNVNIERGTPTHALTVPQAALQVDQAGPFALVVTGEQKVELRRLALGAAVGAGVIVEQGLEEGDLVIVDGIQKVRPGAVVEPTTVPEPVAAAGAVSG